jgi:hypothetical protein
MSYVYSSLRRGSSLPSGAQRRVDVRLYGGGPGGSGGCGGTGSGGGGGGEGGAGGGLRRARTRVGTQRSFGVRTQPAREGPDVLVRVPGGHEGLRELAVAVVLAALGARDVRRQPAVDLVVRQVGRLEDVAAEAGLACHTRKKKRCQPLISQCSICVLQKYTQCQSKTPVLWKIELLLGSKAH